MRRLALSPACVLLILAMISVAQEVLDNKSIVKLVQSGLSDDLIVQMIKSQPGRYTISTDEIVTLKNAGVSEKVLGAMIARNSSPGAPTGQNEASTGSAGDDMAVTEMGVYYKKDSAWTELLPEVVNWKTGGTWKHISTAGIVKKDINGNIPGPHSRNSVMGPLEFLIYAPEGVNYTEYQLLRLRAKENYREFRTVTGGVFNQSSGALRDMVPFEAKKVASRKFSVLLPNNLGAGEYGFIYMGATGSSGGMTSMTMGKMFTFRIIE
jgi:hypothetical protein